ncbi:MAG: helix-turn-helix domain-containing protein [Geminicoccaceae bacterium]
MQQFGAKLELVMKLANLGRGRLAATVGVDKSVISRWLNDQVVPSGPNLSAVTELIRRDRPEFSLLTWQLPLDGFARAVGAPATPPAAAEGATDPSAGLELGVLEVARLAVPREGWVYPGLYLGYRKAFANTGTVVAQGLMLRIEDGRLAARCSDGLFTYRGEALVLRGQLFVLLEESTRLDEVLLLVLNGVSAPMARVIDGLMAGVAGDRTCTPSVTAIAFERQADVRGDASDEELWERCIAELNRLNEERSCRQAMPPEFARVIDSLVGQAREGGELDHVLRVPLHRSLAMATSAVNLRM